MAYAVVVSLMEKIKQLVSGACCHISVVENSSRDMLKLVWDEIHSLEKVLERFNKSSSISRSTRRSRAINRERVNALDGQIRDALCELEDILDFHAADQIHSQIQPTHDQMIHPLMLFTLILKKKKKILKKKKKKILKKNQMKCYVRSLLNIATIYKRSLPRCLANLLRGLI